MGAKNSAKRTAKKAPRGRPFASDDPRRGRGPKKGAGGRTPSQVAEAYRHSFARRLHIAEEVADDLAATPMERLKALDLMGRYGGMASVQVTGADGADLPPMRVIIETAP